MGRNQSRRIVSGVDPKYALKDWRQKKFRVAAYARVSTDSSDQENSLKNQMDHYDKMVPANPNWVYVGLYADDGVSGTRIANRPGLSRLIDDCKAGLIDLIVIKEVSRFARNTADCLNAVQMLLSLDPPIGIYFENNNLNTLDVGTKIILTMFAMFAELDSELKSKSIQFGNGECFEKGNYFCPTRLLGMEKVGKYGMAIEPEGAKTVRLVYDLFLAGFSKAEIAEAVTALGRPTAANRAKWSASSVAGILSNEKYCGDFLMQKTFVESFLTHKSVKNRGQKKMYYEPDHHDGVVTREEHARALLLLRCDYSSPYFDHTYEIRVVRSGLLAGFIPVNAAFGGYDASHYLCALETANVAMPRIEAEVTRVVGAWRVRNELLASHAAAALVITPGGLRFNAAARELLGGSEYAELLLHPAERLLAVRKAKKGGGNAVAWGEKPVMPASNLTRVIYRLMGWQKGRQYRISATGFAKGGSRALFFDLASCECRFREGDRLVNAIPGGWFSDFGDVRQSALSCRRALAEKLADWKVAAEPSPVAGFASVPALTREDARVRIEEMRCDNG